MKFLALLGLVAVASALPYTYKYRFEGQSVSFYPNVDGAATKINADVAVNYDNDYVTMQLSKIILGSSLEVSAGKIAPVEKFDQVELPEQTRKALLLPIRFHYKHGVVSSIEFAHDEPVWTENIKKAVVNMFQMEMDNKIFEKETIRGYNYYTKEKSVEGVCNTTYTVLPVDQEFELTKAIDYTQCETAPRMYNFRFSQPATHEMEHLSVISRLSEQKMIVEKTLRLPKIVESKALYTHAEMRTEVLMRLERLNKITVELSLPRHMRKTDLVYSDKLEKLEEKLYKEGDMTVVENLPVQFENLEKTIMTLLSEEKKSFIRVISLVRLCSLEQLRSIHEQLEESTIRHSLFHRALVLAGSRYSVEHVIDEIIAERVENWEAYTLIQQIAETRYPSELMVHKMWKLIEALSEKKVLRQAALLSTGSLMRAVCFEEMCEKDLKMKWVKLMEKELGNCENDSDKIVIVKMLANAGFDMVVFPLEKIIRSEEQTVLRTEAIEALLSLKEMMPRKISALLLPLIKDARQIPEIRSVAVRVILSIQKLEKVYLIQIVDLLNSEKDMHFYTYALSLLKNEERFESVLGLLRPRKSFRTRYTRVFNKEISLGAIFQHFTTKTGFLPKEMMLTLENVFGTRMQEKLFEVRMRQENLEQLMSILLKKMPTQTAEKMRSIATEMGLVLRRPATVSPTAYIFLTYKGMNYAVLPIHELSTVLRAYTHARLPELKKWTLNHFWAALVHDRVYRVPTILGLPLVFTEQTPILASIKGSLIFNREPKTSIEFVGEKAFDASAIRSLRVEFPFVHSVHKMMKTIRVRLPLHYTILGQHDKLRVKLFTEQFDKKPLVQVEIRPLNSIFRIPEMIDEYELTKEEQKTVLLNKFNMDKVYGMHMLFKVRGHDNLMEVLVEKTRNVPTYYELEMVMLHKEQKKIALTMNRELTQIGEWNKAPLVSRVLVTFKAEEKKMTEITFHYFLNSLVQHFEMLVRHEDRQIIKAHFTQGLINMQLVNNGKLAIFESLYSFQSVLGKKQIKALINYDIDAKQVLVFSRFMALIETCPVFEVLPVKNAENKIFLKLNVASERLVALLETPSKKISLIENVDMPVKESCLLKDSRISTFDDVVYRTPISQCYQILAKDCTDKPQFAVFVKKTKGDYKMVKIIDNEKEIEMEKVNGEFIVYNVDGEKIQHREFKNYGIEIVGDKMTVEMPSVTVEFTGKTVKTFISWQHQGQQCGLCGHYDGDKTNEFIRADMYETEDIEDFHRSYIVEKKECRDEKLEKIYKLEKEDFTIEEEELVEDEQMIEDESEETEVEFDDFAVYKKEKKIVKEFNEDESEETFDETKPEEKTFVKELKNKVCFSKVAVPVCQKDTVIDEEKEMKVRFFCLERSSVEAHRLLRAARKQVLDLYARPDSHVETLRVPKTCIAF